MNQNVLTWRHIFPVGGREGGITLGIYHQNDSNFVDVYMSRCNPKDSYCRKKGREQALKNERITVHIKDLPEFIANYTLRIYKPHNPKNYFRRETEYWSKFALQFVD